MHHGCFVDSSHLQSSGQIFSKIFEYLHFIFTHLAMLNFSAFMLWAGQFSSESEEVKSPRDEF